MPKSDANHKLSPEERADLREFMRLYRERNREHYNEYHREYYQAHKAAHRARVEAWKVAHPEHLEWRRAYNRAWYAKNKAKKGEGNDES